MKQHGFTLIELMVVVAIVAVLSSLVIAAVGSTRDDAKNKTIIQEMNQLRTQAQLYFINTGTYGSTPNTAICSSSMTGSSMINAAMGNGADQNAKLISKAAELAGNTALDQIGIIACYFEPPSYSIAVKLLNSKGVYCIDYRNTGKTYTTGTLNAVDYMAREAGTGILVCI